MRTHNMGSLLYSVFFILNLNWLVLAKRPNIIFVVVDDLGWNDVSWHNPRVNTPNMDKFAHSGIIFNQSYVTPLCSPSRSAFMTGMYPYHMGLQYLVIINGQNASVPLNLTLLPQVLKNSGYQTHIVGKWHLGFCNWAMTPTRRGFDTFYGYYSAEEDYYQHYSHVTGITPYYWFDFRDNESPHWVDVGTYSTHLLSKRAVQVVEEHDQSKPLFLYLAFQNNHPPREVPGEYQEQYSDVKDDHRRILLGMTAAVDEAFGNLTDALRRTGQLDDTIILLTTDNGGTPFDNAGNNYPLRGGKYTMWEGGTRGAGFIWNPKILGPGGIVTNEVIHAVDWFPTLSGFAGVNLTEYLQYPIDGMNVGSVFQGRGHSPRDSFVYNINEIDGGAAVRMGDFKLIVGDAGPYDDWIPEPGVDYSQVLKNEVEHKGKHDLKWRRLRRQINSRRPYTSDREYLDEQLAKPFDRPRYDMVRTLTNRDLPEYLYNISADPTERVNLASDPAYAQRLNDMLEYLKEEAKSLVPAQWTPELPASEPRFWNGVWSPGWC